MRACMQVMLLPLNSHDKLCGVCLTDIAHATSCRYGPRLLTFLFDYYCHASREHISLLARDTSANLLSLFKCLAC
jgi:hypothetical protein